MVVRIPVEISFGVQMSFKYWTIQAMGQLLTIQIPDESGTQIPTVHRIKCFILIEV